MVIEYNDTVLPEVISISVNFSTGLVVFNHSETVDATPKSNFNLERFIVANDDVRDPEFTLSGSFINEKDGVQVSVTLTEALRVKILRYSTQIFGGDGTKFIIKSMPNAIELLSKVDEIVQKEDSKMLALRPIIADKMDALFVVYYYSSIASMGEIVDRVGMSEEFQKLVSEANEYGTLTSSNVLINI